MYAKDQVQEYQKYHKKNGGKEDKLWILMQAPPTDPLYDVSHPDESTTLRPTVDVKRLT